MTLQENSKLLQAINQELTSSIPLKIGVNKKRDLIRLLYEICMRDGSDPGTILDQSGLMEMIEKDPGGIFDGLKRRLLDIRFSSSSIGRDPRIFPVNIGVDRAEREAWNGCLS